MKQLSLKYTPYGDYEKPMYDWIDDFCRRNGILKGSFTWDMIPFDVMKDYAAMDAVCTFLLFQKFENALTRNDKLYGVYKDILLTGTRFLTDIQDNGVPFDKERLQKSTVLMQQIDEAIEKYILILLSKSLNMHKAKISILIVQCNFVHYCLII